MPPPTDTGTKLTVWHAMLAPEGLGFSEAGVACVATNAGRWGPSGWAEGRSRESMENSPSHHFDVQPMKLLKL